MVHRLGSWAGGRGQSAQQLGVHLGAIRVLMEVAGIDAVNKMFGKFASQSHHPSDQDLRQRVEVRGGSGVICHGVGRDMVVGPNGLGNRSVKQPHGCDAVRRDFTDVQPSGEHQGAHDRLFSVVVPG